LRIFLLALFDDVQAAVNIRWVALFEAFQRGGRKIALRASAPFYQRPRARGD
jgi:hypothetical protein